MLFRQALKTTSGFLGLGERFVFDQEKLQLSGRKLRGLPLNIQWRGGGGVFDKIVIIIWNDIKKTIFDL